jgi:hypothetical protein
LVNNKKLVYLVNKQVYSPLNKLRIDRDQSAKVIYLAVLQLNKQIKKSKELDLYLVVLLVQEFLE